MLGLAAALAVCPAATLARGAAAAVPEARTLAFRHTHTGEELSVAYAAGSAYLADALASVNWFLRDFRNGAVHPIDPQLLDQLHRLAAITGTKARFEVISGFRSPVTNQALRARGGGGVAERSLHLQGRAIDIRLPDVPLADLRDAALSLRAGGVGYYQASQFVHVDTGPVRRW